MAVQIAHDPFGRVSLMRVKALKGKAANQVGYSCDECGSTGRQWRYYWQSDGKPTGWIGACDYGKTFCSVGCWRTFHS